jgi:two-component sensor histidine kinase
LSISPVKNATGRVIGASKIARDIAERREADQHRKMLMGELNHRLKNTLAVVQSIASQTLGSASTLDEAQSVFGERLRNLAAAQDVLMRENWRRADVVDVVSQTIGPHAGGENRFRVGGPSVQLAPGAGLAISMALHELATNAAKYGALTSAEGHVDVVWKVEEENGNRRFVLKWVESGGPSVVKPTRRGFGSRLIERALASELQGEVSLEYAPAGVRCTIVAPLEVNQQLAGNPST